MIELIRASNPVLLSALKAALSSVDIPVFEFDGPIADLYVSDCFPRRLMVHEDDFAAASALVTAFCAEDFPALADVTHEAYA